MRSEKMGDGEEKNIEKTCGWLRGWSLPGVGEGEQEWKVQVFFGCSHVYQITKGNWKNLNFGGRRPWFEQHTFLKTWFLYLQKRTNNSFLVWFVHMILMKSLHIQLFIIESLILILCLVLDRGIFLTWGETFSNKSHTT